MPIVFFSCFIVPFSHCAKLIHKVLYRMVWCILNVCIYTCMYCDVMYVYIYVCIYTCTYCDVCIYICMYYDVHQNETLIK